MQRLGRTAQNGKKKTAARAALRERSHPAVAKLAVALREYKEAVEHQAATAEILRIIANSADSTAPVFEAITRAGIHLIPDTRVALFLVRDGKIHYVSHAGLPASEQAKMAPLFPVPLDRRMVAGQAILEKRVMHLADVRTEGKRYPITLETSRRTGYRGLLAVPLMRGKTAIGALTLGRPLPGPFTRKQIALVKTFADQAVIAIENARLFNETKEALERQTATAEILKVISGSPTDVQPVFDAIVQSARRLIGGFSALVTQLVDDTLHLTALTSTSESGDEAARRRYPAPLSRLYGPANAIQTRVPFCIADVESDLTVPANLRDFARARGYRSVIFVPMLRGGTAIGTISVTRREPGPFSDHQIKLLKTFADQAVIAIENVRLFNETKEALEQRTATAEILRVISSTPTDTQPVFDAIVQSGLRVFAGAGVGIVIAEGERVRVLAAGGILGPMATKVDMPRSRDSATGTAIVDCTVINIKDTEAPDAPPYARDNGRALGFRAIAAAPMLREGQAIGAIGVVLRDPGGLTEKQLELLKTFADQAVIAIENARLFNETKEALERQTATADILRVISGSPTDIQPVLRAVAESAARLCDATDVIIRRVEGNVMRAVEHIGAIPLPVEGVAPAITAKSVSGRAVSECRTIHIHDVTAAEARDEYPEGGFLFQRGVGYRSLLVVPMVREGNAIGVIIVRREELRPFSEQQIKLLQTFADQAVIAIENVRLFNETKEALEQQTAISEVLRVISGSPTDVKPVLKVVAARAAKICAASDARIFLVEGETLWHAAGFGDLPLGVPEGGVSPLTRGTALGRAVIDRSPVHVEDMQAAPQEEYPVGRAIAGQAGWHTILAVPLKREDSALGAIVLRRMEVRPFTEKQISLLRTFADQAAIAIENVRLFKETEEALERQTATAEVLKTISRSTFDLDTVLHALLDNATRLSGAELAVLYRPDSVGNYLPAVTCNLSPEAERELLARLRSQPLREGRESASGRALLERRVLQVPDVLADPEYQRQDLQSAVRYRTVAAVPMLRDGEAIGLITFVREKPQAFTDKQLELMATFADQAAIAIENVRLFKEIQEKSAQLEVANKHKSDFLANMSHELRTPLNAIIGFSEVLSEKMFGELNEKQADYMKDIHESGKHLLSLINDILDLSKIEAGRMELDLASFHLPTAISNAMTLVRERAQRHGIRLGLEVDARLGDFNADERKVKQILLNLLSNAVKFTPEGGRVEVSARNCSEKIEIAVRDTGIGIAPEDQSALFEEFKQVGKDSTRKAEGTGLGLALTKRFVELHGGEIRVDSAPGKGSTFTVTLPVRS